MQSIKFAPDLFKLVLINKKLSTVRQGLRDYTLGPVLLETPDSQHCVQGNIIKLELKKFKDLTEEDAKRESYESLTDLQARLKQIYPDLADESFITIVGFDHV